MRKSTAAAPDLDATTRTVASLLGDGWTATADGDGYAGRWSRMLVHRDGRRIRVSSPAAEYSAHRGRWVVHGLLPNTPADENPYTSDIQSGHITCAGSSSPERLAKEIARRLLPALTEGHSTWRSRLVNLRTNEKLRRAIADRLAAIRGVSEPVRQTWNRGERAYHLTWQGKSRAPEGSTARFWQTPHARVTVDHDNDGERVGIELSGLSAEQAEAVLRVLAEDPARPAVASSRTRRKSTAGDALALF